MRRIALAVTSAAAMVMSTMLLASPGLASTSPGSGTWTAGTAPIPSGADDGYLTAVSCTSATSCVAVGSYDASNSSGSIQMPLAETWDGSHWTVQHVPAPSGSGFLSGVSCTSASFCEAVGGDGAAALVEVWNGSTWMAQSLDGPAGLSLNAVSCISSTSCEAVGSSGYSAGQVAAAARWNGTTWTAQTIPNPPGSTYALLSGVSCASASMCIAVGSFNGSGANSIAFTEAWNGTSWVRGSTPNPSGATATGLNAISCPSTTWCEAVGSYEAAATPPSAPPMASYAVAWNGSAWTVQATPAPPSGSSFYENELLGISCTSPSACRTVGYYGSGADYVPYSFADVWDGTSWTGQTVPASGTPHTRDASEILLGVSCPSASACTAVGQTNFNSTGTATPLTDAYTRSSTSPVGVGIAPTGQQQQFIVNSAGHLVTSWQTSPGGNWTTWVDWSAAGGLLGGTTFAPDSSVGVGYGPGGSMEIYLINKSGQLVTMWQTRPGGNWTTLQGLGVTGYAPGSAIGVGVAANKEQEIFLVNTAGALQTMWQTAPGGHWTGLVPLNNITGVGAGAPVGVGYGPGGVMEVYLVNPAGQLMTMWQVAPNGSWTGLQQLNGIGGLTPATPIGLGSGPGGVQELYFVNAAGQLETAWQTSPGGRWTNLVNLNGLSGLQPQAPIGVGKGPDGSQEIYVVNNGSLQTMWQKGPGASWTGWTATGAPWGTSYNN